MTIERKWKFLLLSAGVLVCLMGLAPANAGLVLAPHSMWEYTFTDPTTTEPDWNNTTGTAGWLTGQAPFGNNDKGYSSDPLGFFNFKTYWAADGSDGDDLWVRTSIDLTGYNLSTVKWDLGVDNGFKLFLNGNLVAQDNAELYTWQWEYSGDFSGVTLNQGINVIAVALEDHGGLTAFDMQVTAPEPTSMAMLFAGGVGVFLAKRRRKK